MAMEVVWGQREGEDRFRKIFQLSPNLMLVCRWNDFAILDVNNAFLESFELEKNEVIGKTA